MSRPPQVNPDGTVRRGRLTARVTVNHGGADISSILYYLLKAVFFILCLAEAMALAALVSRFQTQLFGEMAFGFVDIVRMFYPLAILLITAFFGCGFVIRSVDIFEWRRIFFSPLVTLGAFVAAAVLVWLLNLSLYQWWTFVLFGIGFFVLVAVLSGLRNDD